MKKISYALILAGAAVLIACGGETESDSTTGTPIDSAAAPEGTAAENTMADEPVAVAIDHSVWDQALQAHVGADGFVNYEAFSTDANLDAYLNTLETTIPQEDWTREEEMAYWINAYNAYTIKLILKNYPIASITDIDGGQAWQKEWITIGNETLSLDAIENSILRPKFGDGRVHFAINCASFSCPTLHNRAFTAENLEENLEALSVRFVNDQDRNRVGENPPQLSQIFNWFADDFAAAGGVIPFINQYAETPIAEGTELSYMEYDWSLNEAAQPE